MKTIDILKEQSLHRLKQSFEEFIQSKEEQSIYFNIIKLDFSCDYEYYYIFIFYEIINKY